MQEEGLWPWSVHHTWQSWREHYVKGSSRFDALILKYQAKRGPKPPETRKRAADATPVEMLGSSAKRVKPNAREEEEEEEEGPSRYVRVSCADDNIDLVHSSVRYEQSRPELRNIRAQVRSRRRNQHHSTLRKPMCPPPPQSVPARARILKRPRSLSSTPQLTIPLQSHPHRPANKCHPRRTASLNDLILRNDSKSDLAFPRRSLHRNHRPRGGILLSSVLEVPHHSLNQI